MNFQPGLSADAVYDLTSYHIHNHLMNYNHPNTIGLKNLPVSSEIHGHHWQPG